MDRKEKLQFFFSELEKQNSEQWMNRVEQYLTDEEVELVVEHLQDFYGIEDDEQLGHLAQILITGFIAGKEC